MDAPYLVAVVSVGKEEEGLLRPKEVARILGISYRSVYDLIENRKVNAIAKRSLTGNKRFWLIPKSEVEKLRKVKEV
jgi:excisionase family DNA binding protein